MQYSQLSVVKHRVRAGAPLPFNVRNADTTLLLARGQVVSSHEQMEALFERGALVDIAELRSPRAEVEEAAPERLPALWGLCMNRVGDTLRASTQDNFAGALEEAAEPVLSLIERDADLAIFQVLRQDANDRTEYGVTHSVHAAITSFLVTQRLGWDEASTQKVFKAALTMNLSMLELQGQLANQTSPLTLRQREEIHSHPQRSVEMLELSGVRDRDWLDAVAQHHEVPDGWGYPAKLKEVGDMASMLRRADIYTAKLSGRANRDAVAANLAGRQMFQQEPGHPMTAALVKEFGVYPPGCYVMLVSGEMGVVVKRGPTVTTPIVAALTNARAAPLPEPVRRDTSQREHAIAGVLGDKAVRVRVAPERLMALSLA